MSINTHARFRVWLAIAACTFLLWTGVRGADDLAARTGINVQFGSEPPRTGNARVTTSEYFDVAEGVYVTITQEIEVPESACTDLSGIDCRDFIERTCAVNGHVWAWATFSVPVGGDASCKGGCQGGMTVDAACPPVWVGAPRREFLRDPLVRR